MLLKEICISFIVFNNKFFQVVARVSPDIRDQITANGDKLYTDLIAHRVRDRFFVKRCNKCQQFGHYYADCKANGCCTFCKSSEHKSSDCNLKGTSDKSAYQCINCEKSGMEFHGHSAHWGKCPVFSESQDKVKLSIPYYRAKNLTH